MNVLLVTTGSHGDIHPFVALAAELKARGHRPILLMNEYFKGLATEAGIECIPFGEPMDLRTLADYPQVMNAWQGPRVVIEQMLLPHIRDTFALLPDLLREHRIDAVLFHHICLSVPWVCEQAGIPAIACVLAPVMWMGLEDRCVLTSVTPPLRPAWLRRAHQRFLRWAMGATTDHLFNSVRRERNLPPQRNIMLRAAKEAPLVLGLWSSAFRPRHADDPAGAAVCGFPWFDRHREQEHDSAELEEFLHNGEPPILFSLGTAAVHVAGEFYSHAAEACRLLNRRGMLLIGRATPEVSGLTEHVRTFTYAPFSSVMPRVAVNVHHGGVGTTAQALRAGRPMVVVPHAHDQFDNAMRVRELGVGTSVIATRVTGKRLADAIVNVDVPVVRARADALGKLVAAEDGAHRAIDLVEAHLSPQP